MLSTSDQNSADEARENCEGLLMVLRQDHLPFTPTLPLPFKERSRGLKRGRETSAALALVLPGERWHVGPAWPDTCPHHQPTDTQICLCTETHHEDFHHEPSNRRKIMSIYAIFLFSKDINSKVTDICNVKEKKCISSKSSLLQFLNIPEKNLFLKTIFNTDNNKSFLSIKSVY